MSAINSNLFNIKHSIYDSLKGFLESKGYTIGNGEGQLEILHTYPDDINLIHLPSVCFDFNSTADDEYELGGSSFIASFEMGLFAKNYYERDKLLTYIIEYLSKSIPLYDYEAVTILVYNRIRFEDISPSTTAVVTDQGERKYSTSVLFDAVIIN